MNPKFVGTIATSCSSLLHSQVPSLNCLVYRRPTYVFSILPLVCAKFFPPSPSPVTSKPFKVAAADWGAVAAYVDEPRVGGALSLWWWEAPLHHSSLSLSLSPSLTHSLMHSLMKLSRRLNLSVCPTTPGEQSTGKPASERARTHARTHALS